jgi:hypothetical protein
MPATAAWRRLGRTCSIRLLAFASPRRWGGSLTHMSLQLLGREREKIF